MSASKNQAAWIEEAKAHPFAIKDAPFPEPLPDEVVIKTRAVAINPIDMKLQTFAVMPIQYPNILGYDLAGEIVSIGSGVTGFKKGDRVLSQPSALVTGKPGGAAFQKYAACPSTTTAVMPSNMSFEQATVLPTCFSTAAMALFQKEFLGLDLPQVETKPKSKTVFIWGGSSAVGSNAIQLGKAAGYEIIVTSSTKNFDYCKSLGADYVFDYTKPGVIDEIVTTLKSKDVAGGFDTISEDTLKTTIEIIEKTAGKGKVASTHPFTERLSTAKVQVGGVMAASFSTSKNAKPIWGEFLPKALRSGKILPKPDPVIVGKGLESIQQAVDKLKQPISAQKLVVSM